MFAHLWVITEAIMNRSDQKPFPENQKAWFKDKLSGEQSKRPWITTVWHSFCFCVQIPGQEIYWSGFGQKAMVSIPWAIKCGQRASSYEKSDDYLEDRFMKWPLCSEKPFRREEMIFPKERQTDSQIQQ